METTLVRDTKDFRAINASEHLSVLILPELFGLLNNIFFSLFLLLNLADSFSCGFIPHSHLLAFLPYQPLNMEFFQAWFWVLISLCPLPFKDLLQFSADHPIFIYLSQLFPLTTFLISYVFNSLHDITSRTSVTFRSLKISCPRCNLYFSPKPMRFPHPLHYSEWQPHTLEPRPSIF